MTTRIERSENTFNGAPHKIDDKRFRLPGFAIVSTCPACSADYRHDLRYQHLSFPPTNVPFDHSCYCHKCEHEWTVSLILHVHLELAAKRDANRKAALDRLTALSEEYGGYPELRREEEPDEVRHGRDEKHEFLGGAVLDDSVGPDDRYCFYCGETEEHDHHKDKDGKPYFDTDTDIDRMRADGTIAPRCGCVHDGAVLTAP